MDNFGTFDNCMRRFHKIIAPILLLIAAGLSFYLLVAFKRDVPRSTTSEELLVTLVEVRVARPQEVVFTLESQGNVTPRTRTILVSEVSGKINEVSSAFVSGGFFREGETLLKIDPKNYRTQLKQAEASVARAKNLVSAEAVLSGQPIVDWERFNPTSESIRLRMRDRPPFGQAVAEYESALAQLQQTREDLNRTVVKAPYDGIIARKIADTGQYVNAGIQLAETYAVDFVEIRLPLKSQDLQYIDLPSPSNPTSVPVTLTADIGDSAAVWEAEITRSEGIIDPSTRVLYVVVQLADPYDLAGTNKDILRIGTFVKAEIQGISMSDVFVVPRYAIKEGVAWIVNEEDKIYPRTLKVLRTEMENAYVIQGLNDGDRYVVTNLDRPLPGMRVRFDG